MTPPLLEMRAITKRFGGVTALTGVSLAVRAGEVVALAGENGAGKSTLMKILAGAIRPDAGEILLDGRRVSFSAPRDATAAGIGMIHQELELVPDLSVAENVLLGHLPRGPLGTVSRARVLRDARKFLERAGCGADPRRPVRELPVGERQLVEIAKALARNARILVMDEPTSALPDPDARRLLALVKDLRSAGTAVIYISHRMDEIYAIADRIVVLRDGAVAADAIPAMLPPDALIARMLGRPAAKLFPARAHRATGTLLSVEGLSVPDPRGGRPLVEDVSFTLGKGEILGLTGLVGSGASEVLSSLAGRFGGAVRGRAFLAGAGLPLGSPRKSIRAGVAALSNDRKGRELVAGLPVLANTTLAHLARLSPLGLLAPRRERRAAAPVFEKVSLKADPSRAVTELSGGNQQKVALAKWLLTGPRLLLLDEPTRGIDIGARQEIYRLAAALADAGLGIVLSTGELPELLGLADRILVMSRGRVVLETSRAGATAEILMIAAAGAPAGPSP